MNIHFNTNADQELIHLMNKNSLTDFIQNLLIASKPSPTFYETCITLSNIPTDSIQIRAKFIYLLNKFIGTNLSTVDFISPLKQSFLTDQGGPYRNSITRICSYICSKRFLYLFYVIMDVQMLDTECLSTE